MSVEMVALWHKPLPTHAISVFDVGGSGGESGEECY